VTGVDENREKEKSLWIGEYRRCGYLPLPSDPALKKPLVKYRDLWEKSAEVEFGRFPGANVQVVCGCHHRLMVVDLDGAPALEKWSLLARGRSFKTWQVRSGSGGLHLWFAIPEGCDRLASGFHWRRWDDEAQGWARHEAVERLADRKLVMAPPSIHPTTGRMYRFLDRLSPLSIARPMEAPGWLIDLPLLREPRKPVQPPPESSWSPPPPASFPGRVEARDVLDAIPGHEKLALARSWGLRVVDDHANADGWHRARALGREDRRPSGAFHPESGRYWEAVEHPRTIDFFDLAVRLGAWPGFKEALRGLASMYLNHKAS
jgi:hypothetical protein